MTSADKHVGKQPPYLLVGRDICMVGYKLHRHHGEQCVEVSQKARIRTTIWPSYDTPEHIHKGLHILQQKYLPIYVYCCLFKIARKCNQFRCPSTDGL